MPVIGEQLNAVNEVHSHFDFELQELLLDINGRLERYEKLSFHVFVSKAWGIVNGLLTHTLKMRPGSLEGYYDNQVNDWFASSVLVVFHEDCCVYYDLDVMANRESGAS